ncbi:MAG: FAD binding domain-containing protein [Spirochaetaceae bacterium]|jgi:CO/xanthine dehydrogenase FAD-binding subunit|nr:FAD binding domain-containing protein [Spirochaetaceae bacterium]
MAEPANQVFAPVSLADLFAQWARRPEAVLFSCGTKSLRTQRERQFALPQCIISLEKIAELKRISRTERQLEFGAGVKLSKILSLGHIVPEVLRSFIALCDNPALHNIETIGGAIFCGPAAGEAGETGARPPVESSFLAVRGALYALEASYELRTASGSRWISAARYAAAQKSLLLKPGEILTRIRVPLEKWDWVLCRRLPAYDKQKREEGFAAFLARIQNDTLGDMRLVLSGADLLSVPAGERPLNGKKLPLSAEDAGGYLGLWEEILSGAEETTPFLRQRYLNFIREALSNFTE